MELEEYLAAVRSCPDNMLDPKVGVYDNYFLLFKDHYAAMMGRLEAAGYGLGRRDKKESKRGSGWELLKETGRYYGFVSHPATEVRLQIESPHKWGKKSFSGIFLPEKGEGLEEKAREIDMFNWCIILHPPCKMLESGRMNLRAVAYAVEELAGFATEEKIPLCLVPNSCALEEGNGKLFIYYPPQNS